MFAVEIAGEIKPRRYPTKEIALYAARRAARNAPGGASAVVWLNDSGTPKLWLARIRMVAGHAFNRRAVEIEYLDGWTDLLAEISKD